VIFSQAVFLDAVAGRAILGAAFAGSGCHSRRSSKSRLTQKITFGPGF
jgi:hypothetical protein